jgi:hypothetical protein
MRGLVELTQAGGGAVVHLDLPQGDEGRADIDGTSDVAGSMSGVVVSEGRRCSAKEREEQYENDHEATRVR